MGDHLDMELRHRAGGTFDWAEGARLVEEVGEVRNAHQAGALLVAAGPATALTAPVD
ncbi:MAG: hypothetical protein KA711_12570 [Ideonella sp. WA131b]|nr:hypothetical protein [Ideonella sp. WA131b]